jgi:hypothetical protein
MKIVQTYWSLPVKKESERRLGGWPEVKYHYMSWALSCLKLRQFYPEVELITDSEGKSLLIDQLGLPYTSVRCCLDGYHHYPAQLWAVGKLHAYRMQDVPFLHVDGDVFIWAPFPKDLLAAPLLVQSKTNFSTHQDFDAIRHTLFRKLEAVPADIFQYWEKQAVICSVNAGVIGGHHVNFLKEYAIQALDFLDANQGHIHKLSSSQVFNMIFEEHLFLCMAHRRGIPVSYLIPDVGKDFGKVMEFNKVPGLSQYVHLVGFAKKNRFACEQVEMRLRYEFPEVHARVVDLLEPSWKKVAPLTQAKPISEPHQAVFGRTSRLCRLAGVYFAENTPVRVLNRGQFEHLPRGVAQTLWSIYELECKSAGLRKRLGMSTDDSFNQLKKVYQLMERSDFEAILEQQLVLSDDHQIVVCPKYFPPGGHQLPADSLENLPEGSKEEEEEIVVQLCADHQALVVRERVLQGWDRLLAFFTQPTSGYEVLTDLCDTTDRNLISPVMKQNMVNFITAQMIYHRSLRPAPPAMGEKDGHPAGLQLKTV